MLSFPCSVRIYLHAGAVDLRKSFDGLSGLVAQVFPSEALLSGHLFLFLNKRRDRIKILYFERDGLVVWYKRLESGSFEVPDSPDAAGVELQPAQLAMILSGIDLKSARRRKRFSPARAEPGKPRIRP